MSWLIKYLSHSNFNTRSPDSVLVRSYLIATVLTKFWCSIDAAQKQMALNFELVVSDQLFSVVLASYKWFKISAPGVRRWHLWQLECIICCYSALATSRIFSTKLKFLAHSGKGQNRHQDNGDCLERFSSFSLFSWFIVCTLRNLAGSQLDRAVVDGIETLAQMSGGLDKKETLHSGSKVFLNLDAPGYICGMLGGRLQFLSVHHWIKIQTKNHG